MRELIQQILKSYPNARANSPFKGPHLISDLFNRLRGAVGELEAVKKNTNLIVKTSYGKGNWAAVPWLAILDTRETSTTQDGTYVVLLFREDGQGCNLKLGQGVTELDRTLGSRAPVELRKRAEAIREQYDLLVDRSFDRSSVDQRLHASARMAQLYESSSIFSKYFDVESIPDDAALTADIAALLKVYDQYVSDQITRDQSSSDSQISGRRIWALAAGENGSLWQEFLSKNEIAIGWDQLGALDQFDSPASVLVALATEADGRRPTNDALCCYQFANEIQVGDLVVVKVGRKRILGAGIVTSGYFRTEEEQSYKHRRKIQWLNTTPSEFPGTGTTIKTLTEITDYPEFVDFVYGYADLDRAAPSTDENDSVKYEISDILNEGSFLSEDFLNNTLSRLRSKKNLILQGPPGTGKTWLARRLAYALIGKKDTAKLRIVQCHPNLSYEDFIRGYRPTAEGRLALLDGVFMEAIADARNTTTPIVVVVEEINRGNPAQIFGEMLTLIEADKRNPHDAIELTYRRSGGERVYVPENLYLLGTMNIADRSLALLDLALRRRFAFVNLEPTFSQSWRDWLTERCGFPKQLVGVIEGRITKLNSEITADPNLGPQFQIGHSYLTPSPDANIQNPRDWYNQVVQTEIGPLLEEYWFDEPAKAREKAEELRILV
jgi:DNA polymerase III delta prime subunit